MRINPKTINAYNLFHEGTLAFSRAEEVGFRVDTQYIEKKKIYLTRKIERLENKFKETSLFRHWEHSTSSKVNINSPTQLSHFLYKVKKIKPVKLTPTGQGATDEEALEQLNVPELNLLLERNKWKRLRDNTLDGFLRETVNGVIHPNFNLHLARTFRSSSSAVNFQNIPVRDKEVAQICRGSLYPKEGHQLLEVDFKSIEVSVGCAYHKDSTMIKYMKNPKSDMHADMTKQIFKLDKVDKSIPSHKILRAATKNGFVFPEFYGDYYVMCAEHLACVWGKLSHNHWNKGEGIEFEDTHLADHMISKGFRSLESFTKHLKVIEDDFWNDRFSQYQEWKDRWWTIYKKYGYFDLLTGFRCSGVMEKKLTTNYPIQGASFHCNLWCFNELDRIMQEEKWNTRIIGQIHDSIIFSLDPTEKEHVLKTILKVTCEDLPSTWKWINVPLSVDAEITPVNGSWAEKEEFKMS